MVMAMPDYKSQKNQEMILQELAYGGGISSAPEPSPARSYPDYSDELPEL